MGATWLEMEPRHLDPAYVAWATCRLVDLSKVPGPGVVVRVDMRHSNATQRFWMMLLPPRAEVCTTSMGRTEQLILRTDPQTLIDYNMRRISFAQATRAGLLQIDGPRRLARAFPSWIRPSPFAHVTSAR
jgi:hypothetical protein